MENILNNEFRSLMKKHQTLVQNYLTTFGLYMGQPRVLFALKENPGISQQKLSDILDTSKEATSVSIRRLEKSGFIERQECKKDRRINLLKLSEQGYEVVVELRLNFDQINTLMFTDLNDKEVLELKRLLEIMSNSLERRLVDEKII